MSRRPAGTCRWVGLLPCRRGSRHGACSVAAHASRRFPPLGSPFQINFLPANATPEGMRPLSSTAQDFVACGDPAFRCSCGDCPSGQGCDQVGRSTCPGPVDTSLSLLSGRFQALVPLIPVPSRPRCGTGFRTHLFSARGGAGRRRRWRRRGRRAAWLPRGRAVLLGLHAHLGVAGGRGVGAAGVWPRAAERLAHGARGLQAAAGGRARLPSPGAAARCGSGVAVQACAAGACVSFPPRNGVPACRGAWRRVTRRRHWCHGAWWAQARR